MTQPQWDPVGGPEEPEPLQGAPLRGSRVSWKDSGHQCREEVLLVHSPTRLSWKKSNRPASPLEQGPKGRGIEGRLPS